jgi:hypothetical protein
VVHMRTKGTYDLGVVHETLGHNFRSAEFATADEDVDVRAVLCQICSSVVIGHWYDNEGKFKRSYMLLLLLQNHHHR